jgi:hypothetical protein
MTSVVENNELMHEVEKLKKEVSTLRDKSTT